MPFRSIPILNEEIVLPLHFTIKLPFGEYDKQELLWLNNEIRYYGIDKELKRGGRAIAYQGFVADENGKELNIDGKKIVLKVPNLDTEKFYSNNIKDYLIRQCEECGREWELTRARLYKCKYANPIFDFHIYPTWYLGKPIMLPITVQFYLNNAVPLDDYLVNINQRTERYVSKKNDIIDNWNGMNDPSKWIELAKCLAIGLTDIHQRRVAHGDIWPPNIFIALDENGAPYPIFIDFGEAFPVEPLGDTNIQARDHAYRAPERIDNQSIVTQQADVYSFGKLLLHLAIGEEPILSRDDRGYKRRQVIREKFEKRKKGIALENPFIIDIICKCVSFDPVERPSMSEVLRALNTYVDITGYLNHKPKVLDRLDSLKKSWNNIVEELARQDTRVGPFLEELIEQRIYDLEETVKGISNDVIDLKGTREQLVLALISLFKRLGKGDRFISITSPLIWRSSALGLDGRYFTASELAAVRGASIQRVFVFSIQEVGYAWASTLCDNLAHLNLEKKDGVITNFIEILRANLAEYQGLRGGKKVVDMPENLMVDARKQLSQVIKSYYQAENGICANLFDKNSGKVFTSSVKCEGIYFGLLPVSTIGAVSALKSAHPISVFYYSNAEEDDRYLLMMTDCVGRNRNYGDNVVDDAISQSKPELRGVKVFKSVLGVPADRIKKMELEVFLKSVNCGYWVEQLYGCLPD